LFYGQLLEQLSVVCPALSDRAAPVLGR